MKAILEFNLPEDRRELDNALLAAQMISVIHEVDELLRSQLKHGDRARDEQIMARCRDELAELVDRTM